MSDKRNIIHPFILFIFGLAFVLILTFITYFSNEKSNSTINTDHGIQVNLLNENQVSLFSLNGEMDFYWKCFLTPADFKNNTTALKTRLNFPEVWNNKVINGEKLSGKGYATYHTFLYFDTICPMAFQIIDYCNSYKLWLNGDLIAQGGRPGTTSTNTISSKINTITNFTPLTGANELVIQTSNFNENYGGFRQAIQIGTQQSIQKTAEKKKMLDTFLLGIMFLTFIYHMGIYLLNRDQKSFFYFALLVFFIFLRQAFLHSNVFLDQFLSSHINLYLKTAIASAILASLMVIHLFRSIYKKLISEWFVRIYTVFVVVYLLITVPLSMYAVSVSVHWFQLVVLTGMVYIFYLCIRSFFVNSSSMESAGIILLLLALVFETLIFNRVIYSGYVLHYGLITFILLESYALVHNLTKTYRQNKILAKELEEYNRTLLSLVNQKTKEVIDAKERELFSVMLQKSKTDKLITKVKLDLIDLKMQNLDDQKIIHQIIRTLDHSLNNDETQTHLLHYRKINPEFIARIQQKHPKLSQHEIKLCIYQKLILSNKDIAAILHVKPESVRKAKMRMRQKMGLNSDKTMMAYLNQF